jgi:glutaredoxin
MMKKPTVSIFTKAECGLCEKAKALVLKVQADFPFLLQEIDITRDPALFQKYRYVIPVVAIDGRDVLVSKISEFRLRKALSNRHGDST